MTVKTEGQHKGEFLVQELGPISFDTLTYASGASAIEDGTILKDNGSGKAVAAAGTTDTAGDSNETILGIAYGRIDVTGGDVEGPAVARLAVVNTDLVTYSGSKAALIAALALQQVIVR